MASLTVYGLGTEFFAFLGGLADNARPDLPDRVPGY